MATDIILIVSIILFCIAYCVYLPIAIYSIYHFIEVRNNIVIKKRHGHGTLTLSIFAMIIMLGEPTRALVDGFNQKWEWWFFVPTAISNVMLAFAFALKVFLNYFDIKYAKIMIESEWKQIINPTNIHKNWFIQHKGDYNTYDYWKKYIISMTIFTMISMYCWEIIYIYPNNQESKSTLINGIGILYSLFPVSVITYFRLKTPKFIDNFGVRHEIQLILIPGVCLIIFLIILTVLTTILNNELIIQLLHLLNLFIFSSYAFYAIFVCTLWVIRRNKERISSRTQDPSSPVYTKTNLMAITVETQQPKEQQITLEDILNTEQGFNAFMGHIGAEFSSEILLCLVECIQFQISMSDYCLEYYDDDSCFNKNHWIDITESVPKSQIVFSTLATKNFTMDDNNDDMVIEFMAKAYRLYRKYIKVGSSLEINISYELRNTFIIRMDKLDEWIKKWDKNIENLSNLDKIKQIYTIFTPAIEELIFLLDSSFFRFKSSPQYQSLSVIENDKYKPSKSWRNSINIKFSKSDSIKLENNHSVQFTKNESYHE